MSRLELRSGARVRYAPAQSGEVREGVLVKGSQNGEEWLVKNRHGEFWLHVSRLRPPDEDGSQPPTDL